MTSLQHVFYCIYCRDYLFITNLSQLLLYRGLAVRGMVALKGIIISWNKAKQKNLHYNLFIICYFDIESKSIDT